MSAQMQGLLQGDEVIRMLVSIWLDGFVSGGATSLEAVGASEAKAESVALEVSGILQSDPAAMLLVEREVTERLTNRDTGNKSITIKGPSA